MSLIVASCCFCQLSAGDGGMVAAFEVRRGCPHKHAKCDPSSICMSLIVAAAAAVAAANSRQAMAA
jgi:hypothetical protein